MALKQEGLLQKIDDLQTRLDAAEEALRAIQNGEVDALVIADQVYTLESADQTYRVMVEKVQEGVATLQPDGMVLYANQRLAEMLSLPLEQLLGSNLRAYISPADQKLFDGLLHAGKDGTSKGELAFARQDRITVPVLLSITGFDNRGQQVLGLVASDLSEQKKQEEIVASERLARSILDQASDVIVVCDLQGKIIRASQATYHLVETNPLLQPFEQVFSIPANGIGEHFSIAAVLQGKAYHGIEVQLLPDHSDWDGPDLERTLLLSAAPLRNDRGEILGGIVSFLDITGRKQAEKELVANRQHLVDLLTSIQDGFFELDRDWRFTYINRIAAENLGEEPQALIGKNIWKAFPGVRETDHERYYCQVMETRQPAHFEISGTITDRAYDIRVYPSQDGISVFWVDITDRVCAEEETRNQAIRIELQRRLLSQREQDRQRIARDLHDGPVQELTAAALAIQKLRMENQDPNLVETLEFLRTSLHESIAGLREYASELRPPTLNKFGLGKAISSHMEQFQDKYPQIKVQAEIDREEIPLAEEVRLELYRIYQEALNNVAKHCPAAEVKVIFQKEDFTARLEITDNGPGFEIPKDWLALARAGHLGLVGMRERAEAIGGKLWVQSAPGAGTQIQVILPLA